MFSKLEKFLSFTLSQGAVTFTVQVNPITFSKYDLGFNLRKFRRCYLEMKTFFMNTFQCCNAIIS